MLPGPSGCLLADKLSGPAQMVVFGRVLQKEKMFASHAS